MGGMCSFSACFLLRQSRREPQALPCPADGSLTPGRGWGGGGGWGGGSGLP